MGPPSVLPRLLVVDHDRSSLDVLVADLSRRFGKGFSVEGETTLETALAALEAMAAAREPVALLLLGRTASDDAASDFLARMRDLHPQAKRVLLVDRDYS